MKLTRGIRNNNPFNIKRTCCLWKGKSSYNLLFDDTFETFVHIDYGLRAGIVLLQTYLKKGFNTPNKIIARFAPSFENNTKAYIVFVSNYMKLDPYTRIDDIDKFYKLCLAICHYESRYTLTRAHFVTILRKFNINLKFDF